MISLYARSSVFDFPFPLCVGVELVVRRFRGVEALSHGQCC